MPDHDSLCPDRTHPYKIGRTCPTCHAIRYARADERERVAVQIDLARKAYCQAVLGSVDGRSSIAVAYQHAASIARGDVDG